MLALDEAAPMNRAARRRLPKIIAKDTKMTTVQRLTTAAFTRLTTKLTEYGNKLSPKHEHALMRMLGGFSLLASRTWEGRFAYPLDTGCGKSQGVVAWIATVHELGLPFSVAVSAHKVEALCTLKRDMIEAGVPADKIGLWHAHSYTDARAEDARRGLADDFASLPANADSTNHAGFQFLLLTHNRVRGAAGKFGAGASLALTFGGRERDLMVWDESLLISDHRAVTMMDLKSARGWCEPRIRADDQAGQDAFAFLNECVSLLDAELERQKGGQRAPELLFLPHRDADTLEGYLRALPRRDVTKPLATLIEISQNPVRAVTTSQDGGGAYIAYEIAVPTDLKRIAVLDASWTIRRLERLDRTIRHDDKFDGKVKSYGKVTVNYLRHKAGRGGTEASFNNDWREERPVSREVANVIQSIPADEGVLLFTFKQRPGSVDIPKRLRLDLEDAGVNTAATVTTLVWNKETKEYDPVQRPRITVLTFGNETSLSEYSYCKHVIFCGVLFRSDSDLAGAIVGQRNAPLSPVSQPDIAEVRRSEAAHVLYQAISRGACRVVEDGEAHAMSVYLMHPDPKINDVLRTAMPGVVIQPWETKHLKPSRSKADDTAQKIADYLTGLPAEVAAVSVRKLKGEAGLTTVALQTFVRARDVASTMVPWRIEGRSMVRVFVPA